MSERETLADIVADLRGRADCAERHGDRETHNDGVAMFLRSIADRIEAIDSADAWRSLYTPGNAAALREAVVALLDALDSLGCDESTATLAAFVPDMADSSARCLAAFRKAKAALSAPARQCDVGTALEQGERCLEQFNEWRRKSDGKKLITAIMAWAQTPYAEEGGAA